MARRDLFLAAALAGAILVLTACDRTGVQERTVFAPRGYTDSGSTTTKTDENVGIPQLVNDSGQAVHVLAARFESPAPAVRTLYVAAFSNAHGNIELGIGHLGRSPCRLGYTPYPVTDDVIPPHSFGGKYIVIGFKITKPGTYHLPFVRITYTTAGHEYWQDVSIGLTFTARRGKALPPSC